MSSARTDLIAAGTVLVLILGALAWTTQIDLAFSSELETLTGPKAYPRIILGLMLVFDLIVLGGALARLRAGEPAVAARDRADGGGRNGVAKAAVTFLALIVFVAAFEPVGYLLCMIPLMVVVAMMNDAPRLGRAVAVSVLLALACLLLFRYALNTVLPEGLLGIDMVL